MESSAYSTYSLSNRSRRYYFDDFWCYSWPAIIITDRSYNRRCYLYPSKLSLPFSCYEKEIDTLQKMPCMVGRDSTTIVATNYTYLDSNLGSLACLGKANCTHNEQNQTPAIDYTGAM
jgi:hypothetical protein